MAKRKHEDYNNGAMTALSYMAQSGASLQSIVETMNTMVLIIDADTDEGDKKRFVEAFGADVLKSAGVLEYNMSEKVELVIVRAKALIESQGWQIDENVGDRGLVHLVCTRESDRKRKAWGLLDRFACYTEALRSICGKEITEI